MRKGGNIQKLKGPKLRFSSKKKNGRNYTTVNLMMTMKIPKMLKPSKRHIVTGRL